MSGRSSPLYPVQHEAEEKRRRWDSIVRRKYAIEAEDVARLIAAQDFKCPICGIALTQGRPTPGDFAKPNDNWSVDHDHSTEKVRGVLCQECNWGALAWVEKIGREQLRRIEAYLNKSTR